MPLFRKLLCRRGRSVAFALTVLLAAGCGGPPLDRLVATPTPPVQEASARPKPVIHRPKAAVVDQAAVAQHAADVKLWVEVTTWNNVVAWETALGELFPGSTSTYNNMACGGSLPSCCTLQIESNGFPWAQNPISSASGLWQDLTSTWGGFGGFPNAKDAPAGTQNLRNSVIWAWGAGWSNWKGDGCYPGG